MGGLGVLWGLLGVAAAQERLLPYQQEPAALHTDNMDRFYIDYGARLVRWTDQEDRVFQYPAPEEWGIVSVEHAVDPNSGTVHSLQTISKTTCNNRDCDSTTTRWIIKLYTCDARGQCEDKRLASWSRRSGDQQYTSYQAGHTVTERGTLLYYVTKTRRTADGATSETAYTCGGQKCGPRRYQERLFREMDAPPTHRIDPRNEDFYSEALGDARSKRKDALLLDAMAMTSTSFVYDRQGRPHIFYQDGGSRSLRHKYVDESSGTPRRAERTLDSPESGTENAAVRYGDTGVLVFHYFYRDSFNKGVTATLYADAAEEPTWSVCIAHSRDENPGWDLQAAATPQGRVLVGYSQDPRNNAPYVLRLFDDSGQLQASAQVDYQDPGYKRWFGLAGAGVGGARWALGSPGLSDEDLPLIGDRSVYAMDASYELPDALVTTATAEARFGRMVLGASYAQDQLEEIAQLAQDNLEGLEQFSGIIGIDKLIQHHDLRLAYRRSDISVRYNVSTNTPGDAERNTRGTLRSEFTRLDIFLLNTRRVRYGVFRQGYRSVQPFYAWVTPEGATSAQFVTSFVSPVTYQDIGVTVGFSRLDYAAKFENKVTDLFLDVDMGLGLGIAELDKPVTVEDANGRERVETVSSFILPYTAEAGGILLRRSAFMRGVGGYGRLGWRASGSYGGRPYAPGDREEPVEEARYSINYGRTELRHGPFVDVGVVF